MAEQIIDDVVPARLGYRMPAEWEKQSAVWLQWPGKHPTADVDHPLSYQMQLEKTWLLMSWEIHKHARLRILAASQSQSDHIARSMRYFGFDSDNIEIHVTTLADVWHRDSGPLFVIDDKGNGAITDWNFNGWGTYPEWGERERHVAQTVAAITDLPVFVAPLVSEGGAIEVNGTGSLMATRSSIINDNGIRG